MSEDNKNMFVMKRDFNVSGFGYGVEFKKDVPSYVPPLLHTEAMRCGAVALDEENVEHVEAPYAKQPEVQGEERSETITRAMDKLVADNARMSFGADGLPSLKAIYRLTGIDLEMNERNSIWVARAKKLASKDDPSNLTITKEEKAEIAAVKADMEKGEMEKKAAAVEVAETNKEIEEVAEKEAAVEIEKTLEAVEEKPAPAPKKAPPRKKVAKR